MKNRNDQNKYIFAEYKKLQIKRLYKKLNEISQRKTNGFNSISRSQTRQTQRVVRIPKNQDQVRKYQIHQENQRLVSRLSSVKSSVDSHIVGLKKNPTNRIKFQQILKNRAINEENERLAKVISQISLLGKRQ